MTVIYLTIHPTGFSSLWFGFRTMIIVRVNHWGLLTRPTPRRHATLFAGNVFQQLCGFKVLHLRSARVQRQRQHQNLQMFENVFQFPSATGNYVFGGAFCSCETVESEWIFAVFCGLQLNILVRKIAGSRIIPNSLNGSRYVILTP